MAAWAAAVGALAGLLAAGLILLTAGQPRGAPVELLPAPTAAPLQVHISGEVAAPGVYSLPAGSRVQAALDAAGGLLPQADSRDLNLAAPLRDGMRLDVPRQGERPTTTAASASDPAPAGGLININTATQEELESLPGIGPVTAAAIIAYRQEYGAFASIEALMDVPGIGPATFEKLQTLITVDEQP